MIQKLFLYIFFIICFQGNAQFNYYLNKGTPKITNYSHREYIAHPIINDITQNEKGILYLANQRGIIEYDGVKWHLIPTSKNDEVNRVEVIPNKYTLIGTESGLGVLERNELGQYIFKDTTSVLGDLNEPIIDIISNDQFVFIKTFSKVYVLSHQLNLMTVYTNNNDEQSGTKIRGLSKINNDVYFQDIDNGILYFDENVFSKLRGSEYFNNKKICSIVHFNGELIFVTESQGFYKKKYDGLFSLIKTFEDYSFIKVQKIDENHLALGTFSDGVIVVDTSFNEVLNINNEKGLIDDGIKSLYLDHHQQLWVGTNNGISKIDIQSPVLKYENDFKGIVIESISSYNNHLIITSLGGSYKVDSLFNVSKIPGLNTDCFGLNKIQIEDRDFFFISELNRLSYLNKNFQPVEVTKGGPYNVKQSPLDENHLIVLHYNGIESIYYENGEFKKKKFITEFSKGEPFNFVIQENGTMWIGTKPNDGVYKINVSELNEDNPKFTHYHVEDGLPSGQVYMFEKNNQIYAGTDEGVYKLVSDKFIYADDFNMFVDKKPRVVHRINEDHDGNVWAVLIDDQTNLSEIGYAHKVNGKYQWEHKYFSNYSEYIIHALHHDENGVTWLGGSGEGLLSFDSNKKREIETSLSAFIRNISFGDSTIYYGSGELPTNIVFDFEPQSQVKFRFGTNFFNNEDKIEYSYYLEGLNESWSSWSSMTFKEYSLSEGNYTFHLKARNIYGEESDEVSFSFTVAPPWYRTIWAYILYVLALALLIYILIVISIKRIKSQNIRLEALVDERTKEVTSQKMEAEKQRDISESQKVLLEEKNREILDSINYAKRIQSAILPSSNIMSHFFPRHFVFYRPKDIVAGDFYWLQSKGKDLFETQIDTDVKEVDGIYLAAADCTGHGVPGAMVSVVCNNSLNIVLNEFQIKNPADILNRTREMVISEFGEEDNDVKDGMDIALLKFNFDTNQVNLKETTPLSVEYSGANNPLWIVRDKNKVSKPLETDSEFKVFSSDEIPNLELYEIKADKQPIGKFATNDSFTNHEVTLYQSDTIYIFSDGLQDQFGNAETEKNGKKFKPSRLRKLLFSIQESNMEEQNQLIEKAFLDWKGELEQVDDICILGVRL